VSAGSPCRFHTSKSLKRDMLQIVDIHVFL
jgi:hypothetical protein